MALLCLDTSHDWDSPIFKVLANNDTGSAKGHQGGVVIPKELRPFFPGLAGTGSADRPTFDQRVEAELFVENSYRGTVSTRYQFQTWSGERDPESRLTDRLGPLRNSAQGKDILIIQRSIDRLDYYRLTLIRKSSPEFPLVSRLVGSRKWGVLKMTDVPISDGDLHSARLEEQAQEASPFVLFEDAAETTTSTVRKVARSVVFRTTVISLYEETCSLCGEGLRSPSGLKEVDAAHVVPRSMLGSDDARNGFALCKRHHWAFDKGMFGVDDNRKVVVPNVVADILQNASLITLHGSIIREARNIALRVHPDAFKWHRTNLLLS